MTTTAAKTWLLTTATILVLAMLSCNSNNNSLSSSFSSSSSVIGVVAADAAVVSSFGTTAAFLGNARQQRQRQQRLQRRIAGASLPPATAAKALVVVRMGKEQDESSSSSSGAASDDDDAVVDMSDVGFVVLAGGKGSRMKANMPKQFLMLSGAPILHYSLDLFLEQLPAHQEQIGASPPPYVVLVLDPTYQPEYQPIVDRYPDGRLAFADPGVERQGSVENGLAKLVEMSSNSDSNHECKYAAIHDSARPLVTIEEVCRVVKDAKECGSAAVLGVPCKATIKECSPDGKTVLRTIPRETLWEVHTPQVVAIDSLRRGFEKVARDGLQVTDDVSIVEALGEPVRLTRGEYTNLKITTPEDLDVAAAILEERNCPPVNLFLDEAEATTTETAATAAADK